MDFCVVFSIQVEHLSWNPSSYLVSSVVQIKQLSLNVWICEMGTEPHVPVPLYEAKKKKKNRANSPQHALPQLSLCGCLSRWRGPWTDLSLRHPHWRPLPGPLTCKTSLLLLHYMPSPALTFCFALFCSLFLSLSLNKQLLRP